MFWMRNKENSLPICTLIWRPRTSSIIYTLMILSSNVQHSVDLVGMSAFWLVCKKSMYGCLPIKKNLQMQAKVTLFRHNFAAQLDGRRSTRPEVKSAPESTRPWVNWAWVNSARCIFRAFSYVYGKWFVFYMYNFSELVI